MDLNTEAPNSGATPPPSSSSTDSAEPKRISIRETIRQSFDQHRDAPERETRDADRGGERERPAPGQAAAEPEDEEDIQVERTHDRREAGDARGSASTDTDEEADEAPSTREVEAPSSWSKEAKETWQALPERARAEIAKREKDMEKGVKQIKDKYRELDEAFEPYRDTIARFQKTPGQAVHQLFSWFNALAENPREAFPALIDSYKQDPRAIVEHYWPGALQRYAQMEQYIKSLPQNQQPRQQQNGQQQGQPQQQQQQPIVHPQVAQYIQQLEQKLTGLEQAVTQRFTSQDQYYEQQNAARTSEYLDQWSKDKPFFDRVRMRMGYYLTPGPDGQAVVPLKEGKVDLDGAYEQAIWADPEIRAEIQEQQRQERVAKARAAREAREQADQNIADRARRASGSLTSSAPGAEIGRKEVPKRGLSVRESLQQTIKELGGR